MLQTAAVVVTASAALVVGACSDVEGAPQASSAQPSSTSTEESDGPTAGTAAPGEEASSGRTSTGQGEGTAQTSSEEPVAAPTPTGPEPGSCAALAAELSPAAQVGQLFMLGVSTESGVTPPVADALATTQTGHALLLGDTQAGVDGVRALTDALRATGDQPDGVGLLVAADQEGGQVQRLRGPGFDRMPSAVQQAQLPVDELARRAEAWGGQLRAAGVDLDLAPVAGVVPPEFQGRNEPVGLLGRQYGPDTETVVPPASAFVAGMERAGVGTSVKHFPGLGRVEGNTDLADGVVDVDTTRDDPALAAFGEVVDAGASSVMVATAVYDRIDPGVPAAFSPVVVEEMLRGDLGYDGVVISDDLGVAAQVQSVPPGERATRFLQAGGDVVINGDPAIHTAMVEATLALVEQDPEVADAVETKAARVLALKAGLGEGAGLADCTPDAR
ncbi:glycoside hydrolase family 3 N-terminal domain-containing protein [uncultured Serinicoccus sp.]|uniref:glycoside hydrolase family 3 N-terminal domain-containing protein n=1 Tax=uncultured Serinicoccus sp. TaxID=735514 RepID=UPI00260715C8|nr:glycoside hydrolase family 3 N-terminal domain-containing protein [uncultured Serinicoccus sp.]